MSRKTYTDIKEFIIVVKKLEQDHGVKVVLDNDANTVLATFESTNIGQWFSNYGTIEKDWVEKVTK